MSYNIQTEISHQDSLVTGFFYITTTVNQTALLRKSSENMALIQ